MASTLRLSPRTTRSQTGGPRSHTRCQGCRDRRPAPPVGGAEAPGCPLPLRPDRSPDPGHLGQARVPGTLVGVSGHAGDAVALASRAGATSMDLRSWAPRPEGPRSCRCGAGPAAGTGEPSLGLPADLRRVRQARNAGVSHLGAQRPPPQWVWGLPRDGAVQPGPSSFAPRLPES
jgi:hypothetical protein